MLPALLFFCCMMAYYPQIGAATLPSDFLLQRLDLPLFRLLFQLMIFAALLESGTGAVHAINERIGNAWQRRDGHTLGRGARLAIALVILTGCMFLADPLRAGRPHRQRLSAAGGDLPARLRAAGAHRSGSINCGAARAARKPL